MTARHGLGNKSTVRDSLGQGAMNLTGVLGVLTFWGGVWAAVRRFPVEFDWRYMTVSSLLSPLKDPAGYVWASAAIAACSMFGFAWTTLSLRALQSSGTPERAHGLRALQLGYVFTALAASFPEQLLPVPKAHECFAILAFVGLCIGLVRTFSANVLPVISALSDHGLLRSRLLIGISVSPILLAAFAQAYVFFARPELPWVNLSWRDRGVPIYLSFAFWEWVTCAVMTAYMVVLIFMTRGPRSHLPGQQ